MASPKQCKSLRLLKNVMSFRSSKRLESSSSRATRAKNNVLGGVFMSASTRTSIATALHKQDSSTSFTSTDTASTDATFDQTWASSGSPNHHTGAPLLVRSAVSERHLGPFSLSDEEVLGRIMVTKRSLPRANTNHLFSNHVMINTERAKRRMIPLKRNRAMDEIAREHATRMAKQQTLFHAEATDLEEALGHKRIGANVGRGSSLRDVHNFMMKSSVSDKNNITDRRFVSMGVGTAKSADGIIYLCQIFSD